MKPARFIILILTGVLSGFCSHFFSFESIGGLLFAPPFIFALACYISFFETKTFEQLIALWLVFSLAYGLVALSLYLPSGIFFAAAFGALLVTLCLHTFFSFRFKPQSWLVIPLAGLLSAVLFYLYDQIFPSVKPYIVMIGFVLWQTSILVLLEFFRIKNPSPENEEGSQQN